jgi:hypothetical protein
MRRAADCAGAFAGCCSLLVAAVRHRTTEVRRCMALAAASARALLRALVGWQPAAQLGRPCAEELGHFYEALAERKVPAMHSDHANSADRLAGAWRSRAVCFKQMAKHPYTVGCP